MSILDYRWRTSPKVILTLGEKLNKIQGRLANISDTPGLDAQVLLAHVLRKPRPWIIAHPEAELNPAELQALDDCQARLEGGEPLPYVLGHWEFYGLDFTVDPSVLIPRPETELLVEQALGWLRFHPAQRRAADIGTGSGCIATSLVVHVPDLQIIATDISHETLQVARQNAEKHAVASRIDFVLSNLFIPIHPDSDLQPSTLEPFNLILANLPYIPGQALSTLPVSHREPRLALDGGSDGLDLIRRLLQEAPHRLAPDGLLLLEIEASQGPTARELARAAFPQAEVQVLSDLAGKDRLLVVCS